MRSYSVALYPFADSPFCTQYSITILGFALCTLVFALGPLRFAVWNPFLFLKASILVACNLA